MTSVNNKGIRRIAVHELFYGKECLNMCIVELMNGIVHGYYHFEGEHGMVEWLGGTVELKYDEKNNLRAYRNGKVMK